MDTPHEPTMPLPSTIIPNSEERAIQDARLFRSLATPSYLITPAKKRQASDIIADAKARGLMDSFEGMDEWFRTGPVKKVKSNSCSGVKNSINNSTSNKEGHVKNESLDPTKIKQILEQAKKMILNRLFVDDTLPPFVNSDGNTRVIKQSPLMKEIEVVSLSDTVTWQELLDRLVEQKANPLVIAWISEHILYLSMTPAQQTLRQTAQQQWQRLGSKQFNPVYSSREDLVALLTKK